MFTHCLELDITGYSLISWLSCFTIPQLHYICNFHFQSNQVIDMSDGNSQVLVLRVKRFEGLQCWCAGLSDRWLNFDCIILAEVGAHLCQVPSFPFPWWKSSWVKWACLLLINLVSCIQEQDSSWWLTTCLLLPPKANTQTKSHMHIFKPSEKTGLHHKTLLATNMCSVPWCSFTLVLILIIIQPFLIISNMTVTVMHDKQIQCCNNNSGSNDEWVHNN